MDIQEIDFEHFCGIGRHQRDVTRGEPMLPILVLFTETGVEVVGLASDSTEWPAAFEAIRDLKHPTAAILTLDMFLRSYRDGEHIEIVRPRDDPKAENAVFVAASDGRARVMPYTVNDDGSFGWGEPKNAKPGHPLPEALKAMCAPINSH